MGSNEQFDQSREISNEMIVLVLKTLLSKMGRQPKVRPRKNRLGQVSSNPEYRQLSFWEEQD